MNRPQLFARLILAGITVFLLSLAFVFGGCVSSRRATQDRDERHHAQLVTHPTPLDSTGLVRVPPMPPATVPTGPLAAIGNLFSTPEGRARRQAVRLAKATAPKLGKGAVYAVNSTVASGFKTSAPVTQADSGAVVSNAAENSQQQAVNGHDNTLTADKQDTTQQAKDWKAELASPVGKVVAGVAGLVLIAAAGYGFVLWRKKKKTEPLIS